MRSAFTWLATALAVRAGLAAPAASSMFAASELELLSPGLVRAFRDHDTLSTAVASPAATVSNATTCGAFETAATDAPMYIGVTAVFGVPTVSARPAFNWTRDPTVTPRIAVSAGLDGFTCPEAVRSGIYATVLQNGTQQHAPFVEFSGRVYAVTIASVAPGETVRVRVSIVEDDVVNIDWSNLNRTDQAFNKNIPTNAMCGKYVSWLVEDLVPSDGGPGDFFAAFEPVRFTLLEGQRADGNTTDFDAATASFTTESTLCKVDESGTDLVITST